MYVLYKSVKKGNNELTWIVVAMAGTKIPCTVYLMF